MVYRSRTTAGSNTSHLLAGKMCWFLSYHTLVHTLPCVATRPSPPARRASSLHVVVHVKVEQRAALTPRPW